MADDAAIHALRDFEQWARVIGRIRTKRMQIEPFVLNGAQRILHDIVERQLRTKGYVMLTGLKGRQFGATTYFGLRAYQRVTLWPGVRAFIISNRETTTQQIVQMLRRAWRLSPEDFRPEMTASMFIPHLDSSIGCGTAGGPETGRGETVQYLLKDEVAKWPDAASIVAGLEQAVPFRVPGTFDINISTAAGQGNAFHTLWEAALHGQVEHEAVFLPWTLMDEYAFEEPPHGMELSTEWNDYAETHGLAPAQLHWAWAKNRQMAASLGMPTDRPCSLFRQEYPLTADEAFLGGGDAALINPEMVLIALNRTVPPEGPVVLGVDPGGGGNDPTGLIDRDDGRAGFRICEERGFPIDTYEHDLGNYVVDVAQRIGADHICIEVSGGYGRGAWERINKLGWGTRTTLVRPGGAPFDRKNAKNRRASLMRLGMDWLRGYGQIVNHLGFRSQLSWIRGRYEQGELLRLEEKTETRKRVNGKSPNLVDAWMATFDRPVRLSPPRRNATMTRAYEPLTYGAPPR